jgi:hypothetical protein
MKCKRNNNTPTIRIDNYHCYINVTDVVFNILHFNDDDNFHADLNVTIFREGLIFLHVVGSK